MSYRNNATAPGVLLSNSLSVDETRYARTAGFGAEYVLGGNWPVKAEYLRVMPGDTKAFESRRSQADKTVSLAVSQACDARRPIDLLPRGAVVGSTYFEQTADLMPLTIGRSRTIAASCRWRR